MDSLLTQCKIFRPYLIGILKNVSDKNFVEEYSLWLIKTLYFLDQPDFKRATWYAQGMFSEMSKIF